MMIFMFLLVAIVSGVPLQEPLQVTSLKGIPIKGKHPPIGPGTDQGVYNVDKFEGDVQLPHKQPENKNAVKNKALLWPHGAVIYKVEDNVGCPESPQCEILMKAMDNYHENSCVRFKEWTGEDNFVQIFFNQGNSGACWSSVGRIGGAQKLSLGHRCWYLGIVIHELGHSVGFWHEMNRPDRDDWIYIYWKNILPQFSSAFKKQPASVVTYLGEKFDYKSIMMYDEYAFSKDGVSPTLRSKTGEEIGPLWRKNGLSNADIRKLHKLYSCKEGYIYSSYETAGHTPGHLMSVNFHPINEGDKRTPLGCLRFWYLLQSDGTSFLKVSQAYLDKVTQLKHHPKNTYDLWTNSTVLDKWIHVEIPLHTSRPFKLIFQSEFKGGNKYGTIALDDIELLYTECRSENQIKLLPSFSPSEFLMKNDYQEYFFPD
uniref:Metalloendopeptidase n=1 Tax=Rhodnius prolixus TaxID=13249 RepID=T1HN56_RHOPR